VGEVHRARKMHLKRKVVLNVLSVVFSFDPERLARFQLEAELLASLTIFTESWTPRNPAGSCSLSSKDRGYVLRDAR